MLDLMKKSLTLEESRLGIQSCLNAGISVHLTIIVGFPGETEQSVQNTIDFLNSFDEPDDVHLSYMTHLLMLLHNTGMFDQEFQRNWEIKQGDKGEWSHKTMTQREASDMNAKLVRETRIDVNPQVNLMSVYTDRVRQVKRLLRLRNELCRAKESDRQAVFNRICDFYRVGERPYDEVLAWPRGL
jgi:radical SAM superfamily enzyme YgiQ (UPF0313 family)